ncbi:MAG: hypothetical protein CL596_03280 [Alteromonas sp.]|nr:hypothetical protein [Alteromonas sp.]
MIQKFLVLLFVSVSLVSCQFTETMVLQEDGSGKMSLSVDLSEMMAFSGEMAQDSSMVKQDTIIAFKDILEAKKDSISKLPAKEQERLKKMENYKMHMVTDPETKEMVIDIFTEFKDVAEANDLMKGFEQSESLVPGANVSPSEDKQSDEEVIGVSYTYKKGTFKRDAFIKDVAKHKAQVDSLKQAEAFMSGITYKVKYTFPRKIKSTSVEDATFSLDGKTLELQRNFIDYMKNPDVLDIEVVLEKE